MLVLWGETRLIRVETEFGRPTSGVISLGLGGEESQTHLGSSGQGPEVFQNGVNGKFSLEISKDYRYNGILWVLSGISYEYFGWEGI